MSAPAGWYPDTANAYITRYWDGTQWTRELRWDGSAWVDPYAAPPPPRPVTPAATVPVTPTPAEPTPVATPPVETSPPVQTSPFETPPVATRPVAAPNPFARPPATPPAAAMPPTMFPAASAGTKRPSPTPSFWIFAIGSAGVVLSAFLPWVSVSGFGVSVSSKPGTGGPWLLVILAAAVVAIAWPTISSPVLSTARRIGLLPIVGFLALAVVTNWSDLVDLQDQYNGSGFGGISVDPGVGFFLYTVCVIALVVGVVMVWLAGSKSRTAA
jgi:hypothetical protein